MGWIPGGDQPEIVSASTSPFPAKAGLTKASHPACRTGFAREGRFANACSGAGFSREASFACAYSPDDASGKSDIHTKPPNRLVPAYDLTTHRRSSEERGVVLTSILINISILRIEPITQRRFLICMSASAKVLPTDKSVKQSWKDAAAIVTSAKRWVSPVSAGNVPAWPRKWCVKP